MLKNTTSSRQMVRGMMQHKSLENGRWAEMPFVEQMANIGSEVNRTSVWKQRGNVERANAAFERSLELIDLTIKYGRLHEPGRGAMLREICLIRAIFCEEYFSPDPKALTSFDKYFLQFGVASQLRNTCNAKPLLISSL